MSIQQITCSIQGKVQRVMFRDFIQRKARGLRIVGTVQNLREGSVKLVAQGTEEDLEILIEHLHKGPFLARVSSVEVDWSDPETPFQGFRILYD